MTRQGRLELGTVERPTLTVLDGGISAEEAARQWHAVWAGIAGACEAGLKDLHPLHPRRPELLALTLDARAAAQLRGAPRLRSA